MDACPDPEVWAAWEGGTLPAAVRARWEPHLLACAPCRQDLAALAEARPRRAWLPYAAAAAVLLAVGILTHRKPVPPLSPKPAAVPSAPAFTEWRIGRSAEVALEGKGRLAGSELVLESGSAWVESSGDAVRVRMAGWLLELSDGAALFLVPPARTSFLMSEAWADEGGPQVRVARGKVRILSGKGAGEDLLPEAGVEDFRNWRTLIPEPLAIQDSVRELPLPEGQAVWTAEILVRESVPAAEAALVFPAGGRLWEAPLGAYLTGDWVRLRLEIGNGRVRLTAGDLEYFSVPVSGLPDKAYPARGGRGLALRAWGGNVEIREARWRP